MIAKKNVDLVSCSSSEWALGNRCDTFLVAIHYHARLNDYFPIIVSFLFVLIILVNYPFRYLAKFKIASDRKKIMLSLEATTSDLCLCSPVALFVYFQVMSTSY